MAPGASSRSACASRSRPQKAQKAQKRNASTDDVARARSRATGGRLCARAIVRIVRINRHDGGREVARPRRERHPRLQRHSLRRRHESAPFSFTGRAGAVDRRSRCARVRSDRASAFELAAARRAKTACTSMSGRQDCATTRSARSWSGFMAARIRAAPATRSRPMVLASAAAATSSLSPSTIA